MARKRTRNRLEERAPYDEDKEHEEEADNEDEEEVEGESDDLEDDDSDSGDDEDGERPRKKKKVAKSEAAPKAKRASKKNVRLKVVWGVFSNSNQQVATYPFSQESEARAHAERLMNEKKATYFVQQVKVPFDEK
jgi:hypothetical protein